MKLMNKLFEVIDDNDEKMKLEYQDLDTVYLNNAIKKLNNSRYEISLELRNIELEARMSSNPEDSIFRESIILLRDILDSFDEHIFNINQIKDKLYLKY